MQIREITKPRIEKPYNVLVKVIAAGVNPPGWQNRKSGQRIDPGAETGSSSHGRSNVSGQCPVMRVDDDNTCQRGEVAIDPLSGRGQFFGIGAGCRSCSDPVGCRQPSLLSEDNISPFMADALNKAFASYP
ncbi:hypothetical protein [Rhizobium laguerreae]|uniref:hypothetical protein n=1 Tax=Rhizobium laguerreae TaxID=1076926 RepID=UPI00300849EF